MMERRRARCSVFFSWFLALASAAASSPHAAAQPFCLPQQPVCSSDKPGAPLGCLYLADPVYPMAFMGDFKVGLALADINGDGYEDMVLANGYDMAPQQLKVYYNHPERGKDSGNYFNPWPDWSSEEVAYMNGLAVGDINGDGGLDVAVAVAFDFSRETATGGVRVFFNRGGKLEPKSSYQTAGGAMPMDCALADLDADGDLDLIAAVFVEGGSKWPPPDNHKKLKYGQSRIYLNHAGVLSRDASWISSELLGASSVVAADVDQNGWMDVALTGQHTAVYYSQPPAGPGRPTLPREAGWTSADRHVSSVSIDAGFAGKAENTGITRVPGEQGGLMLAVSTGCVGVWSNQILRKCTSRFLTYRPDPQGLRKEPSWSSIPAANASKLRLADLNADGYLDLLASQWGEVPAGQSLPAGGPLWFFQGSAQGFCQMPEFQSQAKSVGQEIAVANLGKKGGVTRQQTFLATRPVAVLTLPQRIVEVTGVETMGLGRPVRRLAKGDYTWVPGENWVSLATPLAPQEQATVIYRVSPVLDIVEATWNPLLGSELYMSFLDPGKPEDVGDDQ